MLFTKKQKTLMGDLHGKSPIKCSKCSYNSVDDSLVPLCPYHFAEYAWSTQRAVQSYPEHPSSISVTLETNNITSVVCDDVPERDSFF